LKVIRGFVESVLRYGLPVDFLAVFVEPAPKKEKQAQSSLVHGIGLMREDLRPIRDDDEEADAEDSDHLPFVCHKFQVSAGGGLSSL
jgi:hypothetical protein